MKKILTIHPLRWDWIFSGSTSLTSKTWSSVLAPSKTLLQSSMRCSKFAGFWNNWYFVEISLSFLCSTLKNKIAKLFHNNKNFILSNILNIKKKSVEKNLKSNSRFQKRFFFCLNVTNFEPDVGFCSFKRSPVEVTVTCRWSNMVPPREALPSLVEGGKLATFLLLMSSTVNS